MASSTMFSLDFIHTISFSCCRACAEQHGAQHRERVPGHCIIQACGARTAAFLFPHAIAVLYVARRL